MHDSSCVCRVRLVTLALSTLVFAIAARPAGAADHFLTIGGGYSPSGNQVSLEKNVLFFRQVLSELYTNAASLPHHVYFSDGDAPGRDLQYHDTTVKVPEARRLLAQLTDEEDDLGYRYRTHAVPRVQGPATRRAVKQWFAQVGAKIPSGDRLIIYVTGHGGHSENDNFANNHLSLWNGGSLSMRDFSTLLDGLPDGVNVVVVMVQCYSGGFADLMFEGGLSQNSLGKSVRCGFFATMPDRQAAGCTPEVDEASYEDYSSSFWAALRGKTRGGVTVEKASCDYDGNGVVSFAEAHAHVLLTDDSIDIPMSTSDRFLRLHSDPGASGGRLVNAEDMLARLNPLATPAERAVIEGLTQQLQLDGGNQYRYTAAKELAETLRAQHRTCEQEEKRLRKKNEDAAESILDALEFRWPELSSRWNPAVDRILADESAGLISAIKSHRRYAEFAKSYADLGDVANRDAALENKWAKCQRLMRTLERIALSHNLAQVADEETLAQYKQLLAAENGTLGAN